MDLVVASFFFYHHSYNFLPSLIRMSLLDCGVDKIELCSKDLCSVVFEGFVFLIGAAIFVHRRDV